MEIIMTIKRICYTCCHAGEDLACTFHGLVDGDDNCPLWEDGKSSEGIMKARSKHRYLILDKETKELVEIEDGNGQSVSSGEWIADGKYWRIRIDKQLPNCGKVE